MNTERLTELMEASAGSALDARRRIEQAVDQGIIPSWVLAACEQWERAALSYGAGIVRRELNEQAAATVATTSSEELAAETIH